MKIGIVMPLKAKAVSKDWKITSENLHSTVNSVINQTNRSFCAAVIGHDKPDFMDHLKAESNCSFIEYTEFEPPVIDDNEAQNQLKYEFDRCTKILKGIMTLKTENPDITHWFSLDADDLIRNDFVEKLEKYSQADSIILENGYFYFKKNGVLNIEDEFSAYCGSCTILSDKLLKKLPAKIDEKSYRATLFGDVSHVHMRKHITALGHSIAIPNERLIMYVRDNGENISNAAYCNTPIKKFKKFVKMRLRSKNIDKEVKLGFGI